MISYTTGNILEAEADCLVNTVNCDGYMGKGIAYQFKLRFPDNNKQYEKECRTKKLRPGSLFVFQEDGKTIINFPTKDKWREKSKEEYIEEGMQKLVRILPGLKVGTVAIPPLGCGNGGLNWNRVKMIISEKLRSVADEYNFIIYEPTKQKYTQTVKAQPNMSPSALVVIDLRRRLLKFDKLRLHKTAYFMNYFLNKQYFSFERGEYGPYSHAIEIVMSKIKEYQLYYGISQVDELYESIYKNICSNKTDAVLIGGEESRRRAASFVNKIQSNHDLEGISTVFYLLEYNPSDINSIWRGFEEWPGGKSSRFKEAELLPFIDILQNNGFIRKNLMDQYEVY